jgi:hypothetical protein
MKKITLWLFLLIGFISFSQINISQNFPTTTAPAGWSNGGGSLTTTQACASASWRFNVYSSSSTTTNALSSETFISTGEPLTVSFDYKIVNWSAATVATTPYNGTISVETSSDNGATFGNAVVAVNNGNHTVANTCATKSIVIPGSSAPGGLNTKIRFKCNFGTSGDYYVYLDNIVITQAASSACTGTPAPGNTIAPTSICVGSSATLSLQNFTPGSGVTYQWYMNGSAISAATNITYVIPAVFSTDNYYCEVTCGGNTVPSSTIAVSPTFSSLPWNEGFESLTTVGSTNFPSCWFKENGAWESRNSNDTYSTAKTGTNFIRDNYTATNEYIWTPGFNLIAGTSYDFSSFVQGDNGTTWIVDYFVNSVQNSTGATQIGTTYTVPGTGSPYAFQSYNKVSATFIPSTSGVYFFAVRVNEASGGPWYVSFDDFKLEETPSCLQPVNLSATNAAATGFDVSWDVVSGAIGYEYFVSNSATPPASGTATTNSYIQPTGLSSQTLYYIHVRTNCGSGFSSWSTTSITTACAPITTLPHLEPFNTFLPNACWSNGINGDLTAGPAAFTASGWGADGLANNGTTGAIKNNIFATGANDWVISPQFTIPSVGYELKFDAAAVQYGLTTAPTTPWESDDSIEVLVSSTGTTNWTPLYTYNDTNQPGITATPNVIDLDVYSGQTVRFAFRALEGVTNGSADIDFSIDNFEVRLSPTCPDETGLTITTITATTASTSWFDTSADGAIGYEYAVTTSATPPVSGTATLNSYYLASGLSPQTVYYLHVRASCAASTFGNWATATFTTACASITTLPWIENFDSVTTPALPTCWSEQNGEYETSSSTFDNTPRSGANYLRDAWSATNEFMWTPGFDLVAGTSYDFSSWVQGDGGSGWLVDYFVNSVQNSSAATQLGATYAVPGTGTLSIQQYAQVTRSFVPATTGTYYFAVRVNQPSFSPNYVAFDDFELKLSPACPTPSASASSVTSSTADVSWSAVPSATLGYEYVLDNVATDPTGSGTSTTATTYAATGLTQLTTYYFHIRSVCSAGTYSTWSTISFTTLATPPVNDNCGSATVLTPGATFAANPLIATNVGATGSTETAPGCASYLGGDVWYSVVVPASGNLTLENRTNAGGFTDSGAAIYSGTCGALVLIDCDDSSSIAGDDHPLMTVTGRTPGEVLYYRVWEYGNNSFSTVQVSAYDASLSTTSFDKSNFVAYPNPVKDVLNLSYKTAISNVSVLNLLGQEVLNTKANSNDVQVNMSTLNTGAYIVNITVEDTVHTIKVIKE